MSLAGAPTANARTARTLEAAGSTVVRIILKMKQPLGHWVHAFGPVLLPLLPPLVPLPLPLPLVAPPSDAAARSEVVSSGFAGAVSAVDGVDPPPLQAKTPTTDVLIVVMASERRSRSRNSILVSFS